MEHGARNEQSSLQEIRPTQNPERTADHEQVRLQKELDRVIKATIDAITRTNHLLREWDNLFDPEKRQDAIARVHLGLRERDPDGANPVRDIKKHLDRFVENANFERVYYAQGEKSTTPTALEILNVQRTENPDLEPVYARVKSLSDGGSTDEERDFLKRAVESREGLEDYLPTARLSRAVILGIPDFMIGRFSELSMKRDHGLISVTPDESGEHLVRIYLQRTGVTQKERADIEQKEVVTISHELHHLQSLVRDRIPAKQETESDSDERFAERAEKNVKIIIDELAASTFGGEWGNFSVFIDRYLTSLDKDREYRKEHSAWSETDERAWEDVQDLIHYLNTCVIPMGTPNLFSETQWALLRHLIAGCTNTQEVIDAVEVGYAIILTGQQEHVAQAA